MALRIATFNLESLDDRPGRGLPLAGRITALRGLLVNLHADILCLQEVNAQREGSRGSRRFAALAQVIAGTDYQDYHLAHSGAVGGPADVHNLVVLSRFPILSSRRLHHDLVPPPGWTPSRATAAPAPEIRWDRPLLHVAVEAGLGRPLHLVNLHLRAPVAAPVKGRKLEPFVWAEVPAWAEGYYIAAMKRTGQALEARLLVDALFDADPQALVLVAGDLNADAGESPVRLLLADDEDTGNEALAARRLTALEAMVAAGQRYTVLHRGRRLLLDHLLASPALAALCRGVTIPNQALADEYYGWLADLPERGSYHAPVVAEIAAGGA
jgi:endonuclease/exonuclease/phosphatase family metal-dependent hydrolase